MIIKIPIAQNAIVQTNILKKVDKSIRDKDVPIVLNCKDIAFVTLLFLRFVMRIYKKAQSADTYVSLTNVAPTAAMALELCDFDKVMEVCVVKEHRCTLKGRRSSNSSLYSPDSCELGLKPVCWSQ